MRALLSGDDRGYSGAAYRLAAGIRLHGRRPDPEGRLPPLLVGTWGPRGAALAGEIADEIKVGGSANPAVVPLIRDRVRVGGQAARRPLDQVRVVVGAVTVVDRGRRRRAPPRPDRGGQVPGRGGRTGRYDRTAGPDSPTRSGTWSRPATTRPRAR